MAKKDTTKKFVTDTEIFTMITKGLDANKICEKAGITLNTLRRRLYEMSINRQELVHCPGLFGERDTFELKKLGLTISRKTLEAQNFEMGQKFKIGFNGNGKKITLTLQG